MVIASIERNGLALPVVPELSEGTKPRANRKPQRSRERHCTTTCSIVKDPRILLQRAKWQSGCGMIAVHLVVAFCPFGASVAPMVALDLVLPVMSFAPIAATPLPCRLPLRPLACPFLRCCLWLPFWNSERERTSNQQRERNPEHGNRNAFALVASGTLRVNGIKSQQRPQRSRKDHCTTTCSI